MSAAAERRDLGPATETRIAAAFAERLTITAEACAELIGIAVRSLREMDEAGLIGGVIVGVSTRRYTEADVRAYLLGEPPLPRADDLSRIPPCRSTKAKRPAATGNTTSSRTSDGFTARRAKLTVVAPSRSKKT